MRKLYRFSFVLCCFAGFLLCSGWGFLVHRTVNQLAIYQLPKTMRSFFYENREYLVRHSVRPDQRRSKDTTEAPKHFIDAEAYGDSALWKMPYEWDKAVSIYTEDTLKEYGYAPYWIMAMKEGLTNAFRKGLKDSILFYAADLAHYIADIHVPLHNTINYDGQLTNQKGLHSLWESTIPEIELSSYQLYNSHRARYLKNPEEAVWKASRTAFLLLDEVFAEEREASREFTDSTKYRRQMRSGREVRNYTSAFAKAYSRRLGKTVNRQLLSSSNLCADFWYTCWVDAGKPSLYILQTKSQPREAEEKLKEELKAFRSNQLLQRNFLLARQSKDEE